MFEEIINMNGNNEDDSEFMPIFPLDDEEENNKNAEIEIPEALPILPLKNTVLFPGVVIPITVGRDKSIKAITKAHKGDRLIAVFAQRDVQIEDPRQKDLFATGTVARIMKLIKMPDGTNTAILQGRSRVELLELTQASPYLEGKLSLIKEGPIKEKKRYKALMGSVRDTAQKIIQLSPNIPSEAAIVIRNIGSETYLTNFIASNLNAQVQIKQAILEASDPFRKAEMVLEQMNAEMQILELKDQIEHKVRTDLDKQQRDYFLNQQLKTIQDELGQNPQEEDIKKLEEKAKDKKWSSAVKEHFEKEIGRLRRINPATPDYALTVNYLELMVDLPWNEFTEDDHDLKKAAAVLDADHYGLEKVKDRILEHLAVLKLKGDMKAPILCLVGPPGVGKTSLGKSLATALGRKYVRMSLGGIHDESEVRGHRRTYIGAMPGRIIQSLRKVKTSNPVFILDEIDKVGRDFRGDPSSALLEVLDPEQNHAFYDNYLETEYDLSKVMFVATANSLNSIQAPLLDRMEIIHVDGYSNEEKVEIAARHLVPKQLEAHGLKEKDAKLSKEVLSQIAHDYTRESGVRELDRQIANVMRYMAKNVALGEKVKPNIKAGDLEKILGIPRYHADMYKEDRIPGVAVGLAWTQVGGDILFIEVSLSKGNGKLTLTGNLGEVMKESATTALSFLQAHAEDLNIKPEVFAETNIHIHVPAGAIPKDGPSAGITMLSALASAFTRKPIKSFMAMTGEITLRGKVLPVGGIKEKILAAKRADIKEIVLCKENEKDIKEIRQDYIEGMKFHYVSNMLKVLELTLD